MVSGSNLVQNHSIFLLEKLRLNLLRWNYFGEKSEKINDQKSINKVFPSQKKKIAASHHLKKKLDMVRQKSNFHATSLD